MDVLSSPSFNTASLARSASAAKADEVPAQVAVKMAKKSMDVQAETASALIATIPDLGQMIDVRA